MQRTDIVERIERERIVAVIRLDDPEKLRAVIDALAAGGVQACEVTMTVPGAIELIARLAWTVDKEVLLGAGTVLDAETARRAIDAGAQFVVSPVFRRDIIAMCHSRGAMARAFIRRVSTSSRPSAHALASSSVRSGNGT